MVYFESPKTERADEAAELLERACAGGTPWACLDLGRRLMRGDGVTADEPRGARILEQGCNSEQFEACVVLADDKRARGDKASLRHAAKLYQRACTGGSHTGCVRLGDMHASGEGMPRRDPAAAAKLYEQECGSFVGSCVKFGGLLETGDGVPKDEARARKVYKDSCDLGDMEGCLRLALALADGRGGDSDPVQARKVLDNTCQRNKHALGCQVLGDFYREGRGGAPNKARANKFYRRACQLGRQQACELLKPTAGTAR
jgi:TPR repeat protein